MICRLACCGTFSVIRLVVLKKGYLLLLFYYTLRNSPINLSNIKLKRIQIFIVGFNELGLREYKGCCNIEFYLTVDIIIGLKNKGVDQWLSAVDQ